MPKRKEKLPRYYQRRDDNGLLRIRVQVPAPLFGRVLNERGEKVRNLFHEFGTGCVREAQSTERRHDIINSFHRRIEAARTMLRPIAGADGVALPATGRMVESKRTVTVMRRPGEPLELLPGAQSSRLVSGRRGGEYVVYDMPIDAAPIQLAHITFAAMVDLWADVTEAPRDRNGGPGKSTRDAHHMFARLAATLSHDDGTIVTPDDIIAHEEALRAEGLSRKTIANHLKAFKAVFRVAKEKRKITVNPMVEIRIRDIDGTARLDFSYGERDRMLLAARQSTDPVIKWFYLLAGFSGMRREEIAEAHTSDIRREGKYVVFHVCEDNRDENQFLKTNESTRKVVVHSAIAEDFMAYVESVPPGPLFPMLRMDRDGKRADTAGKKFLMPWLRDVAGITDPRKSFHSWRHSIATLMCDHGVPERRAFYITGHAPATKGAKYVHHSIPEIAKAIETIPNPFAAAA